MNLADRDTLCFGCGKDNPIGLHMHFKVDEEGCYASFVPQPVHQSYDGRMHGGLISTLLDETMGNYPYLYEHRVAYTARLEVRFRQPVLIGEKNLHHHQSQEAQGHSAGNDGAGGPGGRDHCRRG